MSASDTAPKEDGRAKENQVSPLESVGLPEFLVDLLSGMNEVTGAGKGKVKGEV
jgi:hypothetical protein